MNARGLRWLDRSRTLRGMPPVTLPGRRVVLGLVFGFIASLVVAEEKATPRVPRLGTEWVRVCTMPDLGELAADDPSRQHIVDHGFIRDAHGKWQLWACIRGLKTGKLFYGWEGESLRQANWQPRGIKLRADGRYGERVNPESIQAPFFMKIGDVYHCFYDSDGIRLLTSTDGVNYTRALDESGNNILYTHGGRDVMIRREGDLYYAYSTISVNAGNWLSGFGIVRTSPDLKNWSDYTIVTAGGRAGGGVVSAESNFVVKVDGYYYLFRSSSVTRSCFVYRSDAPYHFGVHDDSKLIAELPVWAIEIIEEDGRMYLSDIYDFAGIRVTTLDWDPIPEAR